jgi:hypothetical protein
MDMGQVTTIVIFIVFWVVFCLVMFWFYGLTPILHWFIKSNGDQARAVILEVRTAGWGWYAGSRYSQSLVFQPVTVKLEVHPGNGAPYIAKDRFNAKPREYWETIKPGAELQVSIARFNPQWVASWPETAVMGAESKYGGAWGPQGTGPVLQAAASAPQKSNTPLIIGIAAVAVILCGCLALVGGFAYWRYAAAGQALSGINSQIVTAMPVGSPSPAPTIASNAGTVPVGGLGDEITRATAWGSAITTILEAEPTSCMSPDGAQTKIEVTHKRSSSGAWQERWMVACDGASAIPVDISFTPAGGGQFTVKATLAK